MSDRTQSRLPKRYLALIFVIGSGLTFLAVFSHGRFSYGSFLLYSLWLLSWRLVDAVGGDAYALTYPGAAHLVMAAAGGVLLVLAVTAADIGVRRLGSRLLRLTSFLAVVAAFAVLMVWAFPVRPVRTFISYDHQSAAADWIGKAQRRQQKNRLGRSPVVLFGISTHDFPELLQHRALSRGMGLLILNADFERAWNPDLLERLPTEARLGNNPIVLATADPAVAQALEGDPSLQNVSQRIRAGDWKLLLLDPSQDAAGLATALLFAPSATSPAEVDWLLRQLRLRPEHGVLVWRGLPWRPAPRLDESAATALAESGTVFVIDNARCGELVWAGVPLRAFYPAEGTLSFDYPATVNFPADSPEEEVAAARELLELLNSERGQSLKTGTALARRCIEQAPPTVVPWPPMSQVRALIGLWQAEEVRQGQP